MNTLRKHLRYATCTLSTQPGFTAVAVLTLALGIGGMMAVSTRADAAPGRDTAEERERPSQRAVIRHPAPDAPLQRRWAWAEAEAARRGDSEYWIAYAFERPLPAGRIFIHDSKGWSMYVRDADGRSTRFSDVPLGTLVFGTSYERPEDGDGPAPRPILVLFHIADPRDGSPRVERISVRPASVGMDLQGDALYWLGPAGDAESFAWLHDRLDDLPAAALRAAVIKALALHEDEERVVPFLADVVRSDRPADVREDAVEGLAWHPTERSVALLKATALQDRSRKIREEAVETLGGMDMPAAASVLEEILRSASPEPVRREAVEAMARPVARQDTVLLETFVRVAMEDPDITVQREAVEAIAEFPPRMAVPALERIARTHPEIAIRREAIQELGELPPELALPILRELVAEARGPVLREAIEAIAEFPPELSTPLLLRIVREHPEAEARREALDQLADRIG